ncbi:DMT family protein [Pectobacterium brasiliense]|uniref:DMT family protein n=1 Tax=Pectobacterium brasiliense TaxID=180957 RepID=UPI002D21B3D1|nr:DMT family protein [Pectobacterium brasiliense]
MVNRGIVLFACFLQVSANGISYQVAFAGIVKILQDAIGLSLFIPFSMFMLKEPRRTDYICLPGTVFFLYCGQYT